MLKRLDIVHTYACLMSRLDVKQVLFRFVHSGFTLAAMYALQTCILFAL
jgi:hypothetical protein